ncbi:MAG: AAA family ATPase [Deltaproteobacteria bacterium]|nr:AAA family ATPase [Deltaproteobacteria bacterium]
MIDSFRALHDLAATIPEMRLMVYELIGLLTAYDTTAFLVGEYNDDDPRALPEFALADGIVQFLRNMLTNRDERYLRVLKLRGSPYLEGLHAFQVSERGLRIFPRLVTPLVPTDYTLLAERVTTGVVGLDRMLDGGYWRGSTTLLVGPTGSGKTTIGLQFAIEGMRLGQPSLYVNLQENPAQIARNVLALGEDPATLTERGLHMLYESPVELRIDSLIIRIFRALEGNDLQRVVIDSVGDIDGAASDPQRLRDYLYSLKQYFAVKRTTCVLTLETARHEASEGIRYGYLADNILQLTVDPTLDPPRTIAVLKARASGHDLAPRPFRLGPTGAAIGT